MMGYSVINDASLYGRSGQPKMALGYYLRDIYDAVGLFHGYEGDIADLSFHLMGIHGSDYLSEEREQELFHHLRVDGNCHAKELIVKAHLPFVVKIAKKILFLSGNKVLIDDLIQAGNIGLMSAVDKFEVDKGVRFFVFAKIRIKTSIWREVYATSRTVTLSRHVCDKMQVIRKKFPQIAWNDAEAPLFEDLEKHCDKEGIGEGDGHELRYAYKQLVSGDNPAISISLDECEAYKSLGDSYMSKHDLPEEVYNFKELLMQVESFIGELPDTQREIIERYFLNGETIEELAQDMPYAARIITRIVWQNRNKLKGLIESKTLETASLEEILELFLRVPSVPRSERTKANGWIDGDTRRKQVSDEIKRRLQSDAASLLSAEDLLRLIRFRDLIATQNLKLVRLIKAAEEKFYLHIAEILKDSVDDLIIHYEKNGIFLDTTHVLEHSCIVADEIVEKFDFDSGMTISQYAKRCIACFLEEKTKLESKTDSLNLLKIWKIRIEKHETEDSMLAALKRSKCKIKGGWVGKSIKKTLLRKSRFAENEEIFLGCLSVESLGFEKGAPFKNILAKAVEMGLQICDQELGLYLAQNYDDQPRGEVIHMAMYGISGSEYGQAIYRIGHGSKGRYVTSICIKPDYFVRKGRRFVFIIPGPRKVFSIRLK